MRVDQFFTPTWLADQLLDYSTIDRVGIVADFAAGDGALLSAARHWWPRCELVATDLDRHRVRKLKATFSNAKVSSCDFLSLGSRRRASCLAEQLGNVDLIVLNPPFSCRGARSIQCAHAGQLISCSTALAFLTTALPFLAKDGELVALMPENTLHSAKDRKAWGVLQQSFVVSDGRSTKRGDFSDCFVQSKMVRLRYRQRIRPQIVEMRTQSRSKGQQHVSIVRGTVQMHWRESGPRHLVHTTDLLQNSVSINGHFAQEHRPSVVGPSVLIPRVGKPSTSKVALFLARRRLALSDCVIGLQCTSSEDALLLHDSILANASEYIALYSGTCARYTTIARVADFLRHLGFWADVP